MPRIQWPSKDRLPWPLSLMHRQGTLISTRLPGVISKFIVTSYPIGELALFRHNLAERPVATTPTYRFSGI